MYSNNRYIFRYFGISILDFNNWISCKIALALFTSKDDDQDDGPLVHPNMQALQFWSYIPITNNIAISCHKSLVCASNHKENEKIINCCSVLKN